MPCLSDGVVDCALLVSLKLQQRFLSPDAATVTAEGSVGSHDTMARDQNCDTVVAVGAADRSHRAGPVYVCREVKRPIAEFWAERHTFD